jgi:hypothetical protein
MTARDLCPPVAAELSVARARLGSLELGVACANRVMLGKGERYRRASCPKPGKPRRGFAASILSDGRSAVVSQTA